MLNSQSNTTNSPQQNALEAVVRCGNAITALVRTKMACSEKKKQLRMELDLVQEAADRLSGARYRTPSIENIITVAEDLLQSEVVASALIVQIDADFSAAKQLFNEARLYIQGRPKTDEMYEQVVRNSNRTERLVNETRSKTEAVLGRLTGAEKVVQQTLDSLHKIEQHIASELTLPSREL